MKQSDYLMLFLVVAGGSFLALAVWSVIVKQQLAEAASANPIITDLTSLLGKL